MKRHGGRRVIGDPFRSGLVAIAAIFAAIGAVASNTDQGLMGWELGARAFPVEAVMAAAFALVPSAGSWSRRRRVLAAVAAGLSTWPSLWLLITTGSRAACGCGDPSSPDFGLPPTIAGIAAYDWLVAAAIAIPLLMLASSLDVPRRMGHRTADESAQ
jgi:hypothetical protein